MITNRFHNSAESEEAHFNQHVLPIYEYNKKRRINITLVWFSVLRREQKTIHLVRLADFECEYHAGHRYHEPSFGTHANNQIPYFRRSDTSFIC